MAKAVFLKGHIDVPADRLEAVSVALPIHIELTRNEAGCVSFGVTPCAEVAGRFLVDEEFVDQAAFDAHQARAGASDWAVVTKDIPRDYKITTAD